MRPTVKQLEQAIRASLTAFGVEEPEAQAECELIMTHATGLARTRRILNHDEVVSEEVVARVDSIVNTRLAGVPIQYCLGEAWFRGQRFSVRPGVFIPRQDTETLVEIVLQLLQRCPAPQIAEVGTGSGAIAISLLSERPDANVSAAEVSEVAHQTTITNAKALSVAARLDLFKGNWLDWLPSLQRKYDVFVSNPPYIPAQQMTTLTREVLQEPARALFGSDEDGLGFYRAFAELVPAVLKEGAFIAVETGDGQADAVTEIFRARKWQNTLVERDLSGNKRVVVAFSGNLGAFNAS